MSTYRYVYSATVVVEASDSMEARQKMATLNKRAEDFPGARILSSEWSCVQMSVQ